MSRVFLCAAFAAAAVWSTLAHAGSPPAATPTMAAASLTATPQDTQHPAATPQDAQQAAPEAKEPGPEPRKRYRPPEFADYLVEEVSFTEARRLIEGGEVSQMVVRDSRRMQLFMLLKDGRELRAYVPGNRLPEAALLLDKVDVRADTGGLGSAAEFVFILLNAVFMFAMMIFLLGMMKSFKSSPASQMNSRSWNWQFWKRKEKRITFADVAGQDEAKRELQEVVEFLKAPKRFATLGARVPKGVLMEGDPGNGKTLLAKAAAGEAGVPFFHVAGSDILEMYAGLGAKRIRQIFKRCRKAAPCLLFIDEIDTIGGRRGAGGGDVQNERDHILNALLVEMDGMGRKGTVVIIGATNRADILDPALVRPGRLDRRVTVSKPDLNGREGILKVHVQGYTLAPEVDLHEVARMTPGFSGAELANLVNEAAIMAGRLARQSVDMESFHLARDKALMGEARSAAGLSDDERRVAAYHEAGHAIVALRSPHADPVHKISVVPRGRALGVVVCLPERDRVLVSRAKLEADLAVALGGRAAEELVFGAGNVTTGAVSDIEQATLIAREMAGRWGMFDELGKVNYLGRSDGSGYGVASPTALARVDDVVRAKLDASYAEATAILTRERAAMDALVARLLEAETISGEEALAILEAASSSAAAIDADPPSV